MGDSSAGLSSPETDLADPELNSQFDRVRLAETFARSGRVRVPDLLTVHSAQRVHRALEKETPWGLTWNNGKETFEYSSVSARDYEAMAVAAWERARSGFQYFYRSYRLTERGITFPAPDHYLAKVVAFLHSPGFFSLVRDVTGISNLSWISATATLFEPLDFLTLHDDGLAKGKLVAYALNMTPHWRPDWGGALLFFDQDHHIEEGHMPTFNSLILFRVPMRHAVGQVAAFGGSRYTISGWFGADVLTSSHDRR